MKVEFRTSTPRGSTEEDIYLDGKKIGSVKTHNGSEDNPYRCHAAINLNIERGISVGLIQGHAETKEAAIWEAIATGRRDFTAALAKIDELEERIK